MNYLDFLDSPEGFDRSYESLAKILNMPKPDAHDVESKAKFTVEVLRTFCKSDIASYIETATFPESQERNVFPHFEKIGKPEVFPTSLDELRLRPKESRFQKTYFAFTGKLKKTSGREMLRDEAIEIVGSMGGKATKNRDQHVTHFVVGENAGRAKIRQAEKNKAIIVTATEFFELIES